MLEREITERVSLTLPDGRFNPDAQGWTRTPLHDTSGIGRRRWGRNKRWEYWNVMAPTHIVALTVSHVDYMSLHSVWVFDRATSAAIEVTDILPLGRSATLPASLGDGPARARTRRLSIDIDENDAGTRLRARTSRLDLDISAERPLGHDALGVVVPWRSPRGISRFQYTVKDVARPARGHITVDGTTHDFDTDAWAVLDHGRGRWPYRVWWNWAAGSGVVDGRVIGLQLGSKWTDGSGSTENALVVDGRLSKISEELRWDYDANEWMRPWRITGDSAELTFTPFFNKSSRTNALVISSRTDQLFGVWSGWARDEHGQKIAVDGIQGFAEDVLNLW
ncbi:DUF2804 domain-containing protein [Microbacterium keratanolyticum]